MRGTSKRVFAAVQEALLENGAEKKSGEGIKLAERIERWKTEGWKRAKTGTSFVLTWDETRQAMDEVLRLLTKASEGKIGGSYLLLGDLYLSGHLTLEPNPAKSLEAYTRASEQSGIPEAQYRLGFLYGSNYGSASGGDEGVGKQGSSLLYYTFAALGGHIPASMTVGYRHWAGIGVKQSCQEALGWYKSAADHAMRTFNLGPPGGRHLPPPKIRLSDMNGGAFGPGASASSRPHNTGGSNSQSQHEWDDLIEFHLFYAERGDASYMFRLGRLYYQGFGGSGNGGSRSGKGRLNVGSQGLRDGLWEGGRDFYRASKWFHKVARGVWQSDGKEATTNPSLPPVKKGQPPRVGHYDATKDVKQKNADDVYTMVAGLAAGYLGRMYMRGEGVRVDYAKAFLWFMRGSGQNDRESNNGLGILYRDGLGVERDVKKANLYFLSAAQADLADAQVNLGKYHFGIGDFVVAQTYFEHAIRFDGVRQPDTFQSYYYLAELQAQSLNRGDQCPHAVAFYKVVAERGDWEHEVWWEAERALVRGDERMALLGYWIMAERGYEAAQNNLAWILDRDKKRVRVPFLDEPPASNFTDRLALAYWTRSAAQDNVDALVKMGDYYYKGLGTEGAGPQLERAASCYQSAVTSRISAMAMWNLGWMHENGKGVAKDYHLAKRYYDMALETSLDAYLPATLSLVSLYARSFYNALFGTDKDLKSLSLFARPEDVDINAAATPVQAWSLGRAWRETQRRWGIDPGPEAGADAEEVVHVEGREMREAELAEAQRALADDDPVEWARRAGRNLDDEDADDFFLGEQDGDFTGTLAIVVLCAILGDECKTITTGIVRKHLPPEQPRHQEHQRILQTLRLHLQPTFLMQMKKRRGQTFSCVLHFPLDRSLQQTTNVAQDYHKKMKVALSDEAILNVPLDFAVTDFSKLTVPELSLIAAGVHPSTNDDEFALLEAKEMLQRRQLEGPARPGPLSHSGEKSNGEENEAESRAALVVDAARLSRSPPRDEDSSPGGKFKLGQFEPIKITSKVDLPAKRALLVLGSPSPPPPVKRRATLPPPPPPQRPRTQPGLKDIAYDPKYSQERLRAIQSVVGACREDVSPIFDGRIPPLHVAFLQSVLDLFGDTFRVNTLLPKPPPQDVHHLLQFLPDHTSLPSLSDVPLKVPDVPDSAYGRGSDGRTNASLWRALIEAAEYIYVARGMGQRFETRHLRWILSQPPGSKGGNLGVYLMQLAQVRRATRTVEKDGDVWKAVDARIKRVRIPPNGETNQREFARRVMAECMWDPTTRNAAARAFANGRLSFG
ncbi:ubiquitin-protein ligase Sel1/Ubx2 [Pseudohyphozyma bogoriensis]|nr:ubiquitin-protein ligase Sel1/Ubx2 [Pseudohyphozyma bogoriensis]